MSRVEEIEAAIVARRGSEIRRHPAPLGTLPGPPRQSSRSRGNKLSSLATRFSGLLSIFM